MMLQDRIQSILSSSNDVLACSDDSAVPDKKLQVQGVFVVETAEAAKQGRCFKPLKFCR